VPVAEAEVKAAEAKAVAAPLPKLDLNSLPVRSYLDQTVVPLLLQGMNQLVCVTAPVAHPLLHWQAALVAGKPVCVCARACGCVVAVALGSLRASPCPSLPPSCSKERPANPVEWLGTFLLRNDPAKRVEESTAAATTANSS
jgi:hypothetical protein